MNIKKTKKPQKPLLQDHKPVLKWSFLASDTPFHLHIDLKPVQWLSTVSTVIVLHKFLHSDSCLSRMCVFTGPPLVWKLQLGSSFMVQLSPWTQWGELPRKGAICLHEERHRDTSDSKLMCIQSEPEHVSTIPCSCKQTMHFITAKKKAEIYRNKKKNLASSNSE